MRPRTTRHLLILAIAGIHAAVMLLGPCLHALPGGRHTLRPALDAAQHHRAGEHSPTAHRSADDCPVCHFLAQGQLPVETASGPVVHVRRALDHLHPPRLASRPCRTLSNPRAPPSPVA